MNRFQLVTDFKPQGDQPRAIDRLADGVVGGDKDQVLLGVTGSGKTFTMACVVERVQRPTLVIAPNKTLAAQLYGEFKDFFPNNAVGYFVSYYDYYQPEAYIPSSDTYIEKDSSINEEIDKMRHLATMSLFERRDVIIVASVSCIYGLGSPEAYHDMLILLEEGMEMSREEMLRRLIEIQYQRKEYDFHRGTFRVRGDVVEIIPAYEDQKALRVEFFGDVVDSISEIDPLTGKILARRDRIPIYPGSHYVTTHDTRSTAIKAIKEELKERVDYFLGEKKFIEAQRIEERTNFDLEMIVEMGFCHGIENYSRHLTGRSAGDPPPTLIDYFPDDFLLFIDESHVTVPQLNGMYRGDRSRKETLVQYGFRLPSALDNRPLNFEEFNRVVNQVIYVSATPAQYELRESEGKVAEQVIRPTGLMDPRIEVRPARRQVDDLLEEVRKQVEAKERTLVTTLTKRMAEDLTDFLADAGIKVRYLHSDIDTIERVEIIRDLRAGKFDVLVGINLLREGLDIPEVSLVAVLDADREGFLRSETSLIQTCGRAARNVHGRVILYADQITGSIQRTIAETERRRQLQEEYNTENNITPETVIRSIRDVLGSVYEADYVTVPMAAEAEDKYLTVADLEKRIKELEQEMKRLAKQLRFEEAAHVRDKIKSYRELAMDLS